MSIAHFGAFVIASLLVLLVPGPTVMLVISQALADGRRVAFASVAGVAAGDLLATSLSLAGAGAVLATSASLFQALKLAGAAYLIWIGIRMWRNPPRLGADLDVAAAGDGRALRTVFRDAFLVTALNPKGILFFVAFVPQFIDPALAYGPQAALYVITFTLLGVVNAGAYGLAAASARRMVRRPGTMRAIGRGGGAVLILAGAATGMSRAGA
ncbi:LysE family translocator [Pseudohoeflea coraliihabitans]|uniref:LysE family translocator n=1 Tax=Pseudohoeflea coraliihabitans TaxID=2860393 RepID=A0ABS6WPX9_9HYPH|nr:LysE family translocator [Pseudohoeflea sp. DP4N28-3]